MDFNVYAINNFEIKVQKLLKPRFKANDNQTNKIWRAAKRNLKYEQQKQISQPDDCK